MELNSQRRWIKLSASTQQDKKVSPTTNGRYINCQYYLLVEPIYGGSMNTINNGQFRVQVTILQPIIPHKPIVAPVDWNPRLSTSSQIYL